MPSNFEKVVCERMEKTGESWQTAARHVRNQRRPIGRFESLVLQIVDLAKKRKDEYRANPKVWPSPSGKILFETLYALPKEDTWKLVALMYSGRDEEDVLERYSTLEKATHTWLAIEEKLPADEYLKAGLARARKSGIDLEGDFQKAA